MLLLLLLLLFEIADILAVNDTTQSYSHPHLASPLLLVVVVVVAVVVVAVVWLLLLLLQLLLSFVCLFDNETTTMT